MTSEKISRFELLKATAFPETQTLDLYRNAFVFSEVLRPYLWMDLDMLVGLGQGGMFVVDQDFMHFTCSLSRSV